MIVGVISDTHGLLRKEVLANLKNCNLIIHAGDIGNIKLLRDLENIAKVKAVRGNCDKDIESLDIKEKEILNVLGKKIYLIHNIKDKDIDLKNQDFDIVIYGHSHKLSITKERNTIYINPGSVGPKRFKLPTTMVKLYIDSNEEVLNIIDNELIKFEDIYVEIINI
ncbi:MULTISPECIES: metallophosphoesterase family protein [Romboutsia]|uniref:Phosphoesterase n=1 Tax=Romboutsia hominis TaxID=1507512 RepID=A0A2P2BUX0_9FIRM|nr:MULTISPECIES: metallophosphoesterase family protein [Romboutsia]MDB8789830.1 metallophosphoesterase family protein [Romboutsia sp. 1001216sp1]MDB8802964.1 metallophosphoesterase family protein [Romboutsia sp. 1001216sp1]MDB8805850.1 metallophosphoesterase family protein [Romboutsia sp. 1001216sp1]MDB8808301.1 metallophosphoesterase family protein [Romboutsia sp. 1001216sp1]MDB8811603.1 metallophosphoesterase family protein [Romboutsia sp. 1001216sp1]